MDFLIFGVHKPQISVSVKKLDKLTHPGAVLSCMTSWKLLSPYSTLPLKVFMLLGLIPCMVSFPAQGQEAVLSQNSDPAQNQVFGDGSLPATNSAPNANPGSGQFDGFGENPPYSAQPSGSSYPAQQDQPSYPAQQNQPTYSAPQAEPTDYPNMQSNPGYLRQSSAEWNSFHQPPMLQSGLVLPVMLDTSLDLNGLKPGDYVQSHLAQNISAGGSAYLPGGSIFYGTIAEPSTDKHFEKGAKLGIEFMQVRLPNGTLIPLQAHLVGRLENYLNNDGRNHGEGFGQKLMSWGWRGGLGSGLASGFGSVLGAIGDGGRGPGSGAFVGAAMGGGSGLMESAMLRRGHDTIMHGGTQLQLQLDSPLNLPWSNSGSNRYLPGTGRNTGIF